MSGHLYKWLLSTGGDVEDPANWSDRTNGVSDGTLPGSADEADFANVGGTITGGLTVGEWVIDPSAGLYTFTGSAVATTFQVGTSTTLLGTWTQTGGGDVVIEGGLFTLGSGASLISENTATNEFGLLVDGALASDSGAVMVGGLLGIGATGTGLTGSGTLSAGAGSSLTAADVQLGTDAGGSGAVVLSNGASANISGYVAIGAATGSMGALTLTGGAMLNAADLVDGAGGSGGMDLSGAGSTVTLGTGGLVVGDGASGSLTVENGATLADGGVVTIGFGSIGSLTVQTGAQLVSVGAEIGRLANSTPGSGTVLLDASTWTSSAQIGVGAGANGSALLQIEDGAILQASATLGATTPFLYVDETAAGQAVVDVGAAVVNAGSNSVDIGEAGFGTLTLHGGAVLDAGSTGGQSAFVLGDRGGASGTATLTGTGTTVNVSGEASIGASGAGTLTISGTFATTGDMGLGVASSGSGVVGVGGVGSDLAIGHQLDLGGGTQAGGTGALTVGSGGMLSAASAMLYGGGAMLVEAGGVVEIGTGSTQLAGQLIVDAGATADTGMDVSGAGSRVALGADGLVVGNGATGLLTLQNDATLTDGGVADIGLGGTGKLTVVTGAQLVSVGAQLGVLSGTTPGSGTIAVNGATWTSSGQIEVGAGKNGSALLRIENGATLRASATLASAMPFLVVDETVAGQAMVDVGSAVVDADSNSVDIGQAGFGTLTLHDGAVLDAGSTGGQTAFQVGGQAGASGTVTLSGARTTVNVDGDATIGASGAGTLTVGGTFVTTGDMGLGIGQSGHGMVTVTGPGSDLAVGSQLNIGGDILAGGTGAVTVGSGGTLTAASLALFADGTLTVDAGGIAEIGSGGTQVAGQLVVDAGLTTGGSGEVAAAVTNQGSLVAQNGTLVVTGLAGGAGSYQVASGATLLLDQPGEVKLGFVGTSGTIALGTASGAADILRMSGGDTLRLVGLGSSPTVSYAGDTATVAGSVGSWSLTFDGAPPALAVSSQGSDALVLACYVAGTAIGTPDGPVPIEHLAVGDRVLTLEGPAQAIVWLGRCVVDCRSQPTPHRVWPVRVAPHAFGPGMPGRPLFLSPDHAVFVDEVLIPVRHLIDGGAIRQVERGVVTYWHLELESHDVVLAEGLPAESFLGDRERFGAMARFGLYPDFTSLHWEAFGYAPLVVTGPALARVRARIGGEKVTALV